MGNVLLNGSKFYTLPLNSRGSSEAFKKKAHEFQTKAFHLEKDKKVRFNLPPNHKEPNQAFKAKAKEFQTVHPIKAALNLFA